MFKGFPSKRSQFNSFPNLNFQMNNEAYGFSGCTFWLDAAYGLNTQTDLAAVSEWKPKIGFSSFLQSTAANQPRLVLSNALYNNYPTVETITNARGMTSNYTYTVFNTIAFVANYNTINNANVIIGKSADNSDIVGLGGGIAGINGPFLRIGGGSYISATTESTTVKIVVMTRDGIWVNGVNEFSGDTRIGRSFTNIFRASDGTAALIGNIAEILIFSQDLTDEAIQLSDLLNLKYAIY